LTQNDDVHDKNVIVSIADFLFQIFIIIVVADLFFKFLLVTVITDHWTSCIFCVIIGPIAKINFTIRYTHLDYHTSTMDDNTNKKKAHKVDSSNDVDPDPQQE
jgi:dolichyl-phosphate-mannose--protein O-mannosyl transferase